MSCQLPRIALPAFLLGLLLAGRAPAQLPSWPEGKTPVCCLKTVEKPVKKIVYVFKWVPYCRPSGCCLSCPPPCDGCPCYRKVLVKKEIVVGTKCETQCVLEYVDCCRSADGSDSAGTRPHTAKRPTSLKDESLIQAGN